MTEQDNKTLEFIRKALLIHGDTYDYSKIEYKKAIDKIIIICKKHGEFLQQSNVHLMGSGCVKCFRDRNPLLQRSNSNDFIEKAKKIYGDTYDYSKVEYIKSNEKIIIICKDHGEFLQTPNKHLHGGCKLCGFSKQSATKSKSKEDFIINAIEIHGDTYDYSKVEYKNNMCKVIIICKEHGDFLQVAGSHLQGHGCKKCSTITTANLQRGSTEEFIEKAIEIHGDIYDYSKVEYINSSEKVIIICKEHGEFLQNAKGHIQKNAGCIKCGFIKLRNNFKHTTDDFITKSIELHGDKYDYSKVIYGDNGRIPVIIVCKIHGEFLQKPQDNLSGCGCRKCSNVYIPDTNEFIEKAKKIHGDKYDYSNVNYTKAKNKIIITCKIHGDFEQEAYCHSIGVGCPVCKSEKIGNIRRLSIYEFLERSIKKHGDKYDYSKVEYINSNEKVIIICKKHGEFLQSPNVHYECGCPTCVNKTEAKLYEKIIPIYPTLLIQFKQEWCKKSKNLPYDFCIPEHNIIIELDGRQHFQQVSNWSSPEEQFENDKYKEECANQNGYSIIRLLQEDVYYDTYDWVKEICDAIEEIKSGEGITNIYLCKNDEYEQY